MTARRAPLLLLAVVASTAACSSGRTAQPGPFHLELDPTTLVAIAASTFAMGQPVQDPGPYGQPWKENELPAHDVTLSGYLLDRDEVTAASYAEFLTRAGGPVHHHPLQPVVRSDGGYAAAKGMGAKPITFVSWYDAATFCAWAGKRLPTEAEWERAARGLHASTYPWGESGPTCAMAGFFAGSTPCASGPADVGSHSPLGDSAEGIHDLAGNVAEWVADVYAPYPADAAHDPTGPASGADRVIRGGGVLDPPAALRGAARFAGDPLTRSSGVGFRCAASPKGGS